MRYRPTISVLLVLLLSSAAVFTQKPGRQKSEPKNKQAQTLVDAGDKLLDDRKWNEALTSYEAALRIDPQNADAYLGLGDVYLETGKWKEALESYKKAVAVAPRNADAQYALGDAYNRMRMHGDAFAPLVKAVQLDPNFAEAHYGIGYAYLSGEQYDKSLSFFKRAIALKPDYDDAHYSLAIAYLHLGNQKGLDDERKKLATLNPNLAKNLADEIQKFNPAFQTAVDQTLVAANESPAPSPTKPASPPPSPTPSNPIPERTASAGIDEAALWNSIKDSKDPEDFHYYLRTYPTGRFADLARSRVPKKTPPFATPEPSAESRASGFQDRQLQRDPSRPATERRTALVIGNGAYTHAPPLKNPPNDARDMVVTLKTLGFEVTAGINVNQREMKRLIREFGMNLKSGGAGLFYYAGHGVQSKGRNYLIPVDAEIQSEPEVEDFGVDVNLVLNFMDDAQNGLNIVILDACRDNPFARSFRSATNGLAQVDAPTGTLIAYATAPGRVASDGAGRNGLYTSELLRQLPAPGLAVTEVFMRVRAEVMKQTANKQVPWEASSLVGSFYFTAPRISPANPTTGESTAAAPAVDAAAIELSYWDSIKNSSEPDEFKAYIEKYPNGHFVGLANNKLRLLEKNSANKTGSDNAGTEPDLTNVVKGDTRFVGAKSFHVVNGVKRTSGVLEVAAAGIRFREGSGSHDFVAQCSEIKTVTINTSFASVNFHKLHIKVSINGQDKEVDLDAKDNKQVRDLIVQTCGLKKQ